MERAPSPPVSAEEALRQIEEALYSPSLLSLPSLCSFPPSPAAEPPAVAGPSRVSAPAGGLSSSTSGPDETLWPFAVADLLGVDSPVEGGAVVDAADAVDPAEEESPSEDDRPSGREARKRAEKNRRTTLTQLVGVLSSLLPTVQASPRKIDKIGVLRLAAHELRQHHVFGRAKAARRGDFGYEAAEAFLRLFDGFFLAVTVHGFIVVASPNVQRILGHPTLDLLGSSVYSLVHPEDVSPFKLHLASGKKGERRDFVVRLLKAGARGEPPRYVYCRLRGGFRAADHAGKLTVEGRSLPRRQRVRREQPLFPEGNDLVIVALGQVLPDPPLSTRLMEASKLEYWTRHLVDGRIIHCDQRIALVAGYMSEEVLGVSAFTFMHKEDVRWVIIALRQMYDQSQAYGESCYRLVSRNGRFMYLRTRGYLEVDANTKAANSFVCMNTLISDEEGSRLIVEMKKKYSAIFNVEPEEYYSPADMHNFESLEDPSELEHVIMCLIDKLPSSSNSSPQSSPANSIDNTLTIIPPQPETIKPSIEKSITVVTKKARKRVVPDAALDSCKRQNLDTSAGDGSK